MSTIDFRAIITKDVCSKDEVLQAAAKYWNCTFEDTDKKVVYAYREERQLFHIWLKSGDDDWDSSLTNGIIHNDICLVKEGKVIWDDSFRNMYRDKIATAGEEL